MINIPDKFLAGIEIDPDSCDALVAITLNDATFHLGVSSARLLANLLLVTSDEIAQRQQYHNTATIEPFNVPTES